MRRKAAHQKRWKLQYSKELERQKAGQRRQASDKRSDEELVTNLETIWGFNGIIQMHARFESQQLEE